MSTLRFQAVQEASHRKPRPFSAPKLLPSEYYGCNVFDERTMSRYLSGDTIKRIRKAVSDGRALDRAIADQVAAAMKTWALERGATHFTHWFQPLTEGTAEKHDSFIDYTNGPGSDIIERFGGKYLAQQEPDASSFPNGGIRNTFEARGYTAWDPSSPAFIIEDTLCIPTVFISYTGEALDHKGPLLRSLNAVEQAAREVCALLGKKTSKVTAMLGWEQEYFLVDLALYNARPDLVMTERTLMGHESARNQQLDDHYFGAVPARVLAFMRELEVEAYKYGIPLKTRHNEVAPMQFEVAPIFGEANLSVDQNLLIMTLMRSIAERHDFKVLLHEKPYDGINGSGKHCNWSLMTADGTGLFTPGKNASENLLFVTFLVNTLVAVYRHSALLKASIMSAQNANRLGGHEAPPAIISVFLGSQITAVLDKLESESEDDEITMTELSKMTLGIANIPEVLLDNTDRNRTSPFAFTGNRFEFRAVGSSANTSAPLQVLNAALAEQLRIFLSAVRERTEQGVPKENAIMEVLRRFIVESKPIRFEGNGYSEEWHREAVRRGLDTETSVPLMFDAYTADSSVKMFEETGVFTERELHIRNEVKWEMYTKKIQIEARVLGDLAMNHIIPVATRYQSILLDNYRKIVQTFDKERAEELAKQDIELIVEISERCNEIKSMVTEMVEARKVANKVAENRNRAILYHDTVLPFFSKIRYHIDKLELIVDNEFWPLPKYRELLFIK